MSVETITFAEYLARPALSASGAKRLLKAAALYRYEMDHPEKHKDAYDFGSVVHDLLLGGGKPIEVLDFDDYKKKAAQEAKAEAYAAGRVPILRDDYLRAEECAASVRRNRLAANLLANGEAEKSWFWESQGVPMKARTDWLTRVGGQLVLADIKTARSASPADFRRAAASYGYHLQDAIHREGVQVATGEEVGFLFLVVETEPPYLPSVIELDDEAKAFGEQQAQRAKETYKHCQATGEWPGYPQTVSRISLPSWVYMDDTIEETA